MLAIVLTGSLSSHPKVNCYDVVGDSDIKTEATLRARMERAADCSPCILLLRHIEALARNTQTLETGKGPSPLAGPFRSTLLTRCRRVMDRAPDGNCASRLFERSKTNVDLNWLPGVRICYIHRARKGASRSTKLLQARGCLRGPNLKT